MKLFSWYNLALGLAGFGLNEWDASTHQGHVWAIYGISFALGAYMYCAVFGMPGLVTRRFI